MKKVMRIAIGIVAKLAVVAIVVAACLGIKYLYGDSGVVVLMAVVTFAWLLLGFFDDDEDKDEIISSLKESIISQKNDIQELNKEIAQWRASAREFQNHLDESQRREDLLHKTLGEKRKEIEYWKQKYNSAVVKPSRNQRKTAQQ
jgi:uncharacterized protein YdiU (UPF0061 family)